MPADEALHSLLELRRKEHQRQPQDGDENEECDCRRSLAAADGIDELYEAGDDEKVHKMLNDHNISPAIKNRSLWKEEPERMLPGHDGTSNVVYDESGTVYCYDTVSKTPVRRTRFERMKKLGLVDAQAELSPQAGDWVPEAVVGWHKRKD